MGWIALVLIGLGAATLLWRIGVGRDMWMFCGAALMLGATGYAWQGRPNLPARPVNSAAAGIAIDPGLVAFRTAIMEGTDADNRTLAAADARLRGGDARGAIEGLQRAVAAQPDNPVLWTGLGSALAMHDKAVSPAAQFAFRRAMQITPDRPGPAFFLGLAYVDSGEFAGAKPAWEHALAVAPVDAPYRADIQDRLGLIDMFMAMEAGQPPAK